MRQQVGPCAEASQAGAACVRHPRWQVRLSRATERSCRGTRRGAQPAASTQARRVRCGVCLFPASGTPRRPVCRAAESRTGARARRPHSWVALAHPGAQMRDLVGCPAQRQVNARARSLHPWTCPSQATACSGHVIERPAQAQAAACPRRPQPAGRDRRPACDFRWKTVWAVQHRARARACRAHGRAAPQCDHAVDLSRHVCRCARQARRAHTREHAWMASRR
jgi:hypothetical protein